MESKLLLKRISQIEKILGPEKPPGELSPEMKAAVDRILSRVKKDEDEAKKEE
jgi:hypothetical protein